MGDLDWRQKAACKDMGELFYPNRIEQAGVPLHICRSHCPVKVECLDWIRPRVTSGMVAGGEHWVSDHGKSLVKVKPRPRTLPSSRGCPICEGLR